MERVSETDLIFIEMKSLEAVPLRKWLVLKIILLMVRVSGTMAFYKSDFYKKGGNRYPCYRMDTSLRKIVLERTFCSRAVFLERMYKLVCCRSETCLLKIMLKNPLEERNAGNEDLYVMERLPLNKMVWARTLLYRKGVCRGVPLKKY